MIAKAVCLLVLLNVVLSNAHFLITSPPSPPTRGFDDDTEPNAPCGGFDTPSTTRSKIALGGSFPLVFVIEDEHGAVVVNWAPGDDPADDNDAYTATGIEYAVNSDNGNAGKYSETVSVWGLSNVVVGTTGTFQIVYQSITANDSAGTIFYQCIDVVFTAQSSDSAKNALPLLLVFFVSTLSLFFF